MRPTAFLLLLPFSFFLTACGDSEPTTKEAAPEKSAKVAVEAPKAKEESKAESPFVAVNVDAKSAAAMLKESPDMIIVDVRTPEEFAEGHIAGAKNIDVKAPDFEAKLSKLDRKAAYVVHCRSGARSSSAMPTFEKLKFENIIHLNTGFNDWAAAGLPVEK